MKHDLKSIILNTIAGIFFAIALFYIVGFFSSASLTTLWSDEAFTLQASQTSIFQIVEVCAKDVHPPLYYWIVRLFFFLSSPFTSSKTDLIIVGKIVSIVPYIILAVFCVFVVGKRINYLTGGLFLFLVTGMPQMAHYATEIRMYSWALLFVTLTYFYAYFALRDGKRGDWIKTTVFALLSAYTQYYALIAVAVVVLYLILYVAIAKREQLKSLLILVGACIVCYLPWLVVLIIRFATVSGGFWIAPLTGETIRSFIYYLFRPYFPLSYGNHYFDLALMGIYALGLGGYCFVHRKEPMKWIYALVGPAVFAGVFVVGVGLSLLLNPMFLDHYLIPTAGCVWLSFAICASDLVQITLERKWAIVKYALVCVGAIFFVFTSAMDVLQLFESDKEEQNSLSMTLDAVEKDGIIVSDSYLLGIDLVYYFDEVYSGEIGETSYQGIFSFKKLPQTDEEWLSLKEKGTIYFFNCAGTLPTCIEWEEVGSYVASFAVSVYKSVS